MKVSNYLAGTLLSKHLQVPVINIRHKRIVEACKGHPLLVEVIGSFLYYKLKDTGYCMEVLDNITLTQDIYKRLYISCSALSDEKK